MILSYKFYFVNMLSLAFNGLLKQEYGLITFSKYFLTIKFWQSPTQLQLLYATIGFIKKTIIK